MNNVALSEKLAPLLADCARTLGAETAFVVQREPDWAAQTIASHGVDVNFVIQMPKRGGRRRRMDHPPHRGSFVGRTLAHGRPAFGTLDSEWDADLMQANGTPLTHALAVPVEGFENGVFQMLVAGFASTAPDFSWALWIAASYARLVSLIVACPPALAGLLERSRRDGLTGCLTYESVVLELEREINRSSRGELPLSCCFIDLDAFKQVNDVHGHLRGNAVLARLGLILREAMRSCDTIGRYGGDEFVVVLPQTDESEARILADRLRALIVGGLATGSDDPLSASIGDAGWEPGVSCNELLARADRALFAAKELSGGVSTFSRGDAAVGAQRNGASPS